MSFNLELKNFTNKAEENSEKIFRATAISLFGRIIKRTPVDSGRLKGNWQVDVNQPATGNVDNIDTTPIKAMSGGSAIKIQAGIGKPSLSDTIYMVNNLSYAKTIERGRIGNKGSNQAPSGMVAVSIAEFKRVLEEEAAKVK